MIRKIIQIVVLSQLLVAIVMFLPMLALVASGKDSNEEFFRLYIAVHQVLIVCAVVFYLMYLLFKEDKPMFAVIGTDIATQQETHLMEEDKDAAIEQAKTAVQNRELTQVEHVRVVNVKTRVVVWSEDDESLS